MKKGFTLVELMVVVLILGILTSVALPQYKQSVRRAEMAEGLIQGKTIVDSAVRYRSVNNVAPTQFNQLDAGIIGANVNGDTLSDANFTYVLSGNEVQATNTKGGYMLRLNLPYTSGDSICAPIWCCPINGDSTGSAVCRAAGKTTPSCGTLPSGCVSEIR